MVPDLSPRWPPDQFQLAALLDKTHWALEQLAYDVGRGSATRGQLDESARALEGLASLLRKHDLDESAGREAAVTVPETERQKWVGDVAEAARAEELPPTRSDDDSEED